MKQITESIKMNSQTPVHPSKFFRSIDLGKYFNLENFEFINIVASGVYGNDVERKIEDIENEVDNQRYSLLNVDPLIVNTSLYTENYKLNKEDKYTIILIDLKKTTGEQPYNMYLAISDALVRKIKLGR